MGKKDGMLWLCETSEKDYEDYYRIRCSATDIYWNGHLSKPDKVKFKEIFLSRVSSAPFNTPEDAHILIIRFGSNKAKSEPVGFVQLVRRKDGIELGLGIVDEYQGLGFGTQAMQLAIKYAQNYGCSLFVCVRDDNVASQKMVMKCGFLPTNEYTLKQYPLAGEIKLRKYIFNNHLWN